MRKQIDKQKQYTVDEGAQLLGVTPATIRRWLNEKYLKGKKVPYGKGIKIRWLINGSEINKILNKISLEIKI